MTAERRNADSQAIMRQASAEFRGAWQAQDANSSDAALRRASAGLQELVECSQAAPGVRLEAQLLFACVDVLNAGALSQEAFDQVHRGWWQMAKRDEQGNSRDYLWHAARAMEEATWAALLRGDMHLVSDWGGRVMGHYRSAGVSDWDVAAMSWRFKVAANDWVLPSSGWFHGQPEKPDIILGSEEAQEIFFRHAAFVGRPGPPVARNPEGMQRLAEAPGQFIPSGVRRPGLARS